MANTYTLINKLNTFVEGYFHMRIILATKQHDLESPWLPQTNKTQI